MATLFQKTEDPRHAYILGKIEEMQIRFPVAELSKKMGKTTSNVSETLNGKRAVSESFFRTFCEVYGLDGNTDGFKPDDPFNWERAKLIALERRLAKLMMKDYEAQGKKRTLDECLDEIDSDTEMILTDLRRSGRRG